MWSATNSTISSLLSIETIVVGIELVDEIWFPFFFVLFIVKFNRLRNLNFHTCQAVAWKVEVITSCDTNNMVIYVAPVVCDILPVSAMYLVLHFWQMMK